ncbi:hypothetical protein ASPBRDRAFT_25544 [Aspergillus brasiliensis CBS 101740]|uniref:MARVEL domain-containing protein n=1 Tax=Aspergillus brasiliensis (strain CBS 101740 / IMI 381727 / IBT 21946) TaxID=767769 RepID=A0A1L9V1Y9_ASPBC|nr:hypothetical protein ASPBRDRAFT_25544 [Aspergillus brasiliensis CBS 101740]
MSNNHLPITITTITVTLLFLASFSLTTYTLTTYLHLAHTATSLVPKAIIHDTGILATTSYHIFTTILTSVTLITTTFLFPRIIGIKWIQKTLLTSLATLLLTTSLLAYTIILATRKVSFGDVGPHVTVYLDEGVGGEKRLVYRDDGRAVAGLVLGWVGWLGMIIVCGLLVVTRQGKSEGRGEVGMDSKKEVEESSRTESV